MYCNLQDLKGKKLAVYSQRFFSEFLIRIALANAHGLMWLESGDIEFVEMPPQLYPAALESGTIDATTLIHSQTSGTNTKSFRSIVSTAPDNYKSFGVRGVSAVLAGYGEKLDKNPEIHKEFLVYFINRRICKIKP